MGVIKFETISLGKDIAVLLSILRIGIFLLLAIFICVVGSLFCLLRPRDPNHVWRFGHLFGHLAPIFGIKVIKRYPSKIWDGSAIYVANHQNNYDMVTLSGMTQLRTVTVGKSSLLWVPFFGPLYWLSGNILIDRENRFRAHSTLQRVANQIQRRNISVWMFPEGTRSRDRGLMPFKTGAFYTAILAGVPIIPICVSNLHNRVKLSRRDNGSVIMEMLPPIHTSGLNRDQAKELAERCHQLMLDKVAELDREVALKERSSGEL